MGRLELIRSVATQVADTKVISEDKNDVRLLDGDLLVQRLICPQRECHYWEYEKSQECSSASVHRCWGNQVVNRYEHPKRAKVAGFSENQSKSLRIPNLDQRAYQAACLIIIQEAPIS